jgi:hypothetical protein
MYTTWIHMGYFLEPENDVSRDTDPRNDQEPKFIFVRPGFEHAKWRQQNSSALGKYAFYLLGMWEFNASMTYPVSKAWSSISM